MAQRGRKPKPVALKLVTGNPGKRPIPEEPADAPEAAEDNGLEPPKKLRKRQGELWAKYIRRAYWLTEFDVPRAFMWVELHAEFEKNPTGMVAARMAQLRALGSELGMDPASRQRIGASGGGKTKKDDPTEEFFT